MRPGRRHWSQSFKMLKWRRYSRLLGATDWSKEVAGLKNDLSANRAMGVAQGSYA